MSDFLTYQKGETTMQVQRTIGITFSVNVEIEDDADEDAIEDAVAQAGVDAFKDNYGMDVRAKDIIIFDEGDDDDE